MQTALGFGWPVGVITHKCFHQGDLLLLTRPSTPTFLHSFYFSYPGISSVFPFSKCSWKSNSGMRSIIHNNIITSIIHLKRNQHITPNLPVTYDLNLNYVMKFYLREPQIYRIKGGMGPYQPFWNVAIKDTNTPNALNTIKEMRSLSQTTKWCNHQDSTDNAGKCNKLDMQISRIRFYFLKKITSCSWRALIYVSWT